MLVCKCFSLAFDLTTNARLVGFLCEGWFTTKDWCIKCLVSPIKLTQQMYDRKSVLLIDHLTTNVMCRVEYLIWCGLHTLALCWHVGYENHSCLHRQFCSSSSYSCVSLVSLCQDDRDMVPRTVRELVIEYLIWCGHCTQLSSFDCITVSAWVSCSMVVFEQSCRECD